MGSWIVRKGRSAEAGWLFVVETGRGCFESKVSLYRRVVRPCDSPSRSAFLDKRLPIPSQSTKLLLHCVHRTDIRGLINYGKLSCLVGTECRHWTRSPRKAAGQRGARARRCAAREAQQPARRTGGDRAWRALQQSDPGKPDCLSEDA